MQQLLDKVRWWSHCSIHCTHCGYHTGTAKLQLNCSKLILLQINCIFLAITLKVLWQRKTRNNQVASNKNTVKYITVYSSQLCLVTSILCMAYRSLLKAVILLLPLLGTTWIIGIFNVNNETLVFAWIFAILNCLQVSDVILLAITTICGYLGCLHIYISCDKKQAGKYMLFDAFIFNLLFTLIGSKRNTGMLLLY